MNRYASLLALCMVASPAAAGIGGEIAYSVGRDIYLVNPDGSGKRLLYRGATKTSIFSISMKKDGGELSFEQASQGGQTGRLISISYGNSGPATVTRNIPGCRFAVSTRADGALLAIDSCNGEVKFAPAGSSNFQPVGVPRPASKVAWMADGSLLYASHGEIWHATLTNQGGTAIAQQDCVQNINSAHNAAEALVTDACEPRILRMEVPSGTMEHVSIGPDAAYSQDDQCIIVLVPPSKRGSFLMMLRLGSSAPAKQFGNSANYTSVDWRGDSNPSDCPLPANNALEFRTVK